MSDGKEQEPKGAVHRSGDAGLSAADANQAGEESPRPEALTPMLYQVRPIGKTWDKRAGLIFVRDPELLFKWSTCLVGEALREAGIANIGDGGPYALHGEAAVLAKPLSVLGIDGLNTARLPIIGPIFLRRRNAQIRRVIQQYQRTAL